MITKEQIKAYCESYISSTPYDIAIMELHRIINCDFEHLEVIIKETRRELELWWERNKQNEI